MIGLSTSCSWRLIAVLAILIDFAFALPQSVDCQPRYSFGDADQSIGVDSLPEQIDPVPYQFSILDSLGRAITEYTDQPLTVRLTGKTAFKGFLIAARQSTVDGELIGKRTVGRFIPDDTWLLQGIRINDCRPGLNDSISHSNNDDRLALEVVWRTEKNDGIIQFVLSVFENEDKYWKDWKPTTGLIRPKKNAVFATVDSDDKNDFVDKSDQKSILQEVEPRPAPISDLSVTTSQTPQIPQPQTNDNRFNISLLPGGRFLIRVQKPEGEQQTLLIRNSKPIPFAAPALPEPPAFNVNQEIGTSSVAPLSPAEEAEAEIDRLAKELCPPYACFNNGTCLAIVEENRYECACTELWTGDLCDVPNNCYKHKCENGARCVNGDFNETNSYVCQCNGNWAGEFCERPCPTYLCKNGGKCVVNDNGKYGCECVEGFVGDSCQTNVDDCANDPCLNGGTCVDKVNDYVCTCPPGFMGQHCHRPCQDIYKSCKFWKEQDRCETMRPVTKFFDLNCAVTCDQCEYDNVTVINDNPLPPVLEPLAFLLGKWSINSTRNFRHPLDFDHKSSGYYEELTFIPTDVIMFGTPAVNVTAIARNFNDSSDQQVTVGFMTLKTAGSLTEVSLMTTGNDGMTVLEEGELSGNRLQLETRYLAVYPQVADIALTKSKRIFSIRGKYLQETVERHRNDGQSDFFTKYYFREEEFLL